MTYWQKVKRKELHCRLCDDSHSFEPKEFYPEVLYNWFDKPYPSKVWYIKYTIGHWSVLFYLMTISFRCSNKTTFIRTHLTISPIQNSKISLIMELVIMKKWYNPEFVNIFERSNWCDIIELDIFCLKSQ